MSLNIRFASNLTWKRKKPPIERHETRFKPKRHNPNPTVQDPNPRENSSNKECRKEKLEEKHMYSNTCVTSYGVNKKKKQGSEKNNDL